jgi:hypothetical protein
MLLSEGMEQFCLILTASYIPKYLIKYGKTCHEIVCKQIKGDEMHGHVAHER